jgi:hypothetical protein
LLLIYLLYWKKKTNIDNIFQMTMAIGK